MSFFERNLSDLLVQLDPIGLEETNAQASLMRRVDTKYVIRPDQLLALLPTWTDQYRILEINGERSSHYRSVYYDTPDLVLYHAHHAGAASRVKFRLREYTESALQFFEVKVRSNKGITDKQRARLRDSHSAAEQLERSVRQHPRHIGTEPVQETLRIDYDRITLVSKTGSQRVTIDRNLRFTAKDRSVSMEDRVIIEVKQDRSKRTPLDQQFRSIGIRPGSISKYCLGILQLFPDAKRNRFKMPLRILDKQLRNHGTTATRGGERQN